MWILFLFLLSAWNHNQPPYLLGISSLFMMPCEHFYFLSPSYSFHDLLPATIPPSLPKWSPYLQTQPIVFVEPNKKLPYLCYQKDKESACLLKSKCLRASGILISIIRHINQILQKFSSGSSELKYYSIGINKDVDILCWTMFQI